MTVDRSLMTRGHVDVDQIVKVIEDAGVGTVRVERLTDHAGIGIPLYFFLYFKELGSRKKSDERMIRGHHGDQADSEGPFPGEPYTSFATGAYGCTDVILKALGQQFGGVYEDEHTGEEIVFEVPSNPAP